MSDEKTLVTTSERPLLPADKTDYKAIAISFLKNTGGLKDFTEAEQNQFIDMCVTMHLNPIKREVYGVKYKSKDGSSSFNLIVGYEVYLKRAQRTGLLDGFTTKVEGTGPNLKAICTIYRKDWTHPFVHEVFLREYDQQNRMWKEKPITMLKKVAEEQAFRKCFPDELGGLPYAEEEINTTSDYIVQPEAIRDAGPYTKATAKAALESPENRLTGQNKATEIGLILSQKFPNGNNIFNSKDKDNYREMIRTKGATFTLEQVKLELDTRNAAFENGDLSNE